MHAKCPVHISMLLVLIGTVTTSRPKSGVILGKATEFQLSKNWVPPLHKVSRIKILAEHTSDDEDLVVDGSGGNELQETQTVTVPYLKHSSYGSRKPCCEVGHSFGETGIHCDAELHHNKLTVRSNCVQISYGKKLENHLKQRGRDFSMSAIKTCVLHRSHEFYKCCQAARTDRIKAKSPRKGQRANDKRHIIPWRFMDS